MAWLGKVLGAGAGYLLGGPLGAILGAAFGHQAMDNAPRSFYGVPMSEMEVKNSVFFVAIFSMLGKLAQADEVVTEDEIDTVKQIVSERFHLSAGAEQFAIETFNNAIHSEISFQQYADQFYDSFRNEPEILTSMLELLLVVAHADSHYHEKEEELIESAAGIFGLSDAYQHILGSLNGSPGDIDRCYEILGCSPEDDLPTVKKKYRELAMQFHPDRIQSKGLPKEFMQFATDRFQEIQEAFEIVSRNLTD
ncbi:MAG: TerB family tellurite resistance protein [Pseudomonadales bacterium]|jgi:DnaJ like chaperone protein|nr:TerB family tellurite resistance protein [Pseudomonadales bacterium]MDP7357547.1 TerB family tellurite resistance protein [Pseudomonadales bacterium]MDP7597854.1 TerB family tellurite resistance protein [Pseudomonadales bacterium]HJN51090.1 TerB family tellurite resistance protein [Pseudomonadales bacterium]|tara:strand:+ start:688 stop:1440 length:753 start_codon:yes stop_codon:yes gene_type:complete